MATREGVVRTVVFPERKEREFSEGSNLQPVIPPAKGEDASKAIRPPGGRGAPGRFIEAGLPALALALALFALFSLSVFSRWKERKRPAPPVAALRTAPVPASLADDEPHSFARLRADYARWQKELLHWFREGDPGLREARRLDLEVERQQLPPTQAARACLQRHLMRLVTIDSIEPIGYERVGEGVAIDYRAVVRCRIDLYAVAAFPVPVPKRVAEPVARIWPDLLFDAYLPPGCHHDVEHKYRLLAAGEPFVFRWRVERAQVVDGRWKILWAAPALLEWNCGFVAAEILALRNGEPYALRIAGDRCLLPFSMADEAAWNELVFRYHATWGVPGAERPGIAARAQGWLRATEPRLFAASGPLLELEKAPRLSSWTLTLPAYAARTDWAGPLLAPVRALQPQDAESRFVAYYRARARERNRWIDSFVLQRAQIEEQKGKSPLRR